MFTYDSCAVLVTGAGGSIGTALCAELVAKGAHVYGLARSEESLLNIPPGVRRILGNTTDYELMRRIMAHIDVVFHCAAHKHVSICEVNPGEARVNNVTGLATVLRAARAHMVRDFVFLSTDKAQNPTSVYGKTKAENEAQIVYASRVSDINYKIVRLCNVFNTSGSVLPKWRAQIAAGGPLTLSHPEATRYFMTMDQATAFLLAAPTMDGVGPHVPQGIEPTRLMDIAQDMIFDTDVKIEITGLAPGERLHETLVVECRSDV